MNPETYDVVIIGAGPSGVGAAAVLAGYSLKILLIDENNQIGGQIWRKPVYQPPKKLLRLQTSAPRRLLDSIIHADKTNLNVISPACVLGIFPEKHILLSTGKDGVKEIKARKIILATGAREKVRPFKGWTLPGVMTLGAAQLLLKYYGVLASPETLIAGAGPLVYILSSQILSAGGKVTAVLDRSSSLSMINAISMMADQLPKIGQGALALCRLLTKGVWMKHSMQVVEVIQKDNYHEVVAAKISAEGTTIPGSRKSYKTRMLACGNGFIPNIELPQLAGCNLTHAADMGGWVVDVDSSMETSVRGIFAAGEITGISGGEKAVVEGRLAALSILRQLEKGNVKDHHNRQAALLNKRKGYQRFGSFLNRQWAIHPREWSEIDDDTIICRCEDITMGTIRDWIAKGITSATDLKKATRCGMGNCQGRTCGPLIYDILAACCPGETHGRQPLSVRAPVKPVPLGDLAALGS